MPVGNDINTGTFLSTIPLVMSSYQHTIQVQLPKTDRASSAQATSHEKKKQITCHDQHHPHERDGWV